MAETVKEGIGVGRLHVLNRDERVDGILVQLPLPPQIDERKR